MDCFISEWASANCLATVRFPLIEASLADGTHRDNKKFIAAKQVCSALQSLFLPLRCAMALAPAFSCHVKALRLTWHVS